MAIIEGTIPREQPKPKLSVDDLANELFRVASTHPLVFRDVRDVPVESLGVWGYYQSLCRQAKETGYFNFTLAMNFLEATYGKKAYA